MTLTVINGVRLFWERTGDAGRPIVLVHGSWGDHHNWDRVVPGLALASRVFTYDRRGHSESERPVGQGRLEEDVEDLAAFIRSLGCGPVHAVGNSGGAIVVLKLAARYPDLLAGAAAHEPPLIGMIQDHPMIPAVRQRIGAVVGLLQAGKMEGAARLFVETIAFAPGAWEQLPPEMQRTFVFNAPTFLDESNEGEGVMSLDLDRLAAFAGPLLLTQGDASAPFFATIVQSIASALPAVQRYTFRGAGHVPHLTSPDEYAEVIGRFVHGAGVPGAEVTPS